MEVRSLNPAFQKRTLTTDCLIAVPAGGDEMRMRVAIVASVLLGSVLVPVAVGTVRGMGLNEAADGNQTLAFAESYYIQVVDDLDEYTRRRNAFSESGQNEFGQKVDNYSACQALLAQSIDEDEMLLAAALRHQRSSVLKTIFDQPAIGAIEALPAPIVGALGGCRYTMIGAACDAWAGGVITRANERGTAVLQRERKEWLRSNEAASCKASAKFVAPLPKS